MFHHEHAFHLAQAAENPGDLESMDDIEVAQRPVEEVQVRLHVARLPAIAASWSSSPRKVR